MRVCGIIAEYDPLHSGHARHLREARRGTEADAVVCVMSASFTQRGMPALLPPLTRAEMALRAGADIVLGLPVSFSVCNAERFALGGVSLLARMGAAALSFGVEPDGIPCYQAAARLLERPDGVYLDRLHALLAEGESFPCAQGAALAERLSLPPERLAQPNTALAVCYARAVLRLGADMTLYPVPREGDYHASTLEGAAFPSASAVRAAVLAGGPEAVRRAVPAEAFPLLQDAFARGLYHPPEALDGLLRWKLRRGGDFARLPDLSEGLQNRLPLAADCFTRDEMVQAVKSKRYSYARVSRLLTHALLETDAARLSPLPEHAYVLGFRRAASPLLRAAKERGLCLCSGLAGRELTYEMTLDARADDLWSLGAGRPFGDIYRFRPVIL